MIQSAGGLYSQDGWGKIYRKDGGGWDTLKRSRVNVIRGRGVNLSDLLHNLVLLIQHNKKNSVAKVLVYIVLIVY
jgi:hypothetical protein